MRKYFLLFLIFVSTIMLAQQNWYVNSRGTIASTPYGMQFVNENEGWLCGSNASIYHTTDGGLNWESQTSNFYSNLNDICFINNKIGFAVGDRRAVVLTTDGGKNWILKKAEVLTDTSVNIQKVHFFDATTGIAIAVKSTTAGYILKTTDGGNSWAIKYTATKSLLNLSFGTNNNGIVTGKDMMTILYTTDGGDSWTAGTSPAIPTGYTRSDLFAAYMIGANTAFASGWGSEIGLQPTIYLKSTDGGKTWAYMAQADENKTYFNNNVLYFKDENHGYAFGGTSSTVGGRLAITTDGGVNWIPTNLKSSVDMSVVNIFSNKVYFLGSLNLVFKADDISGTNLVPLTSMNAALSTIDFASSNTGYVGSNSSSAFLKTTDGGKNWLTKQFIYDASLPLNTKFSQTREFISFDDNNVYWVGTRRVIAKTSNGGDSWSIILPDTNVTTGYTFNSACFLDQNTGWAVGRHAGTSPNYKYAIYKTVNGGTTWSQLTGDKELNGIDFKDATTGITVGKGGNIMYTTDGGSTWTATTSPIASSLVDVKFITSTKIMAISDSGRVIVSTDAGKTWSLNSQIQSTFRGYNFNSLYVKDQQNIYICGYRPKPTLKGTLIYSNDGGNIFTDLSDTTVFENNMVGFTIDPSGNMWGISPSGSVIYSTKNLTGIEAIGAAIPASYELGQNYPNPFNPSTTINWKMMNQGKVEIRIFDMIGKEVKTLVNETKDAGTYKVSWDGRNNSGKTVSTGIYYYMLKANNFVNVKKMMLLK